MLATITGYSVGAFIHILAVGPKVREAKAIAERDLKAGDTLSDEFMTLSQRIGQVGTLAGVIVVITIFFMTVKP